MKLDQILLSESPGDHELVSSRYALRIGDFLKAIAQRRHSRRALADSIFFVEHPVANRWLISNMNFSCPSNTSATYFALAVRK